MAEWMIYGNKILSFTYELAECAQKSQGVILLEEISCIDHLTIIYSV